MIVKKVALLGGSHFIGVHLLNSLHQQGHDITVYNRNLTRLPVPYPQGTKLIIGDRNNPEDLRRLFAKEFDVVFDLSGFTPKHVESIAINYRSSIGHYIFCSTPCVYKIPPPCPLNEKAPRIFDENTYGGDKALVEDLLLKSYNDSHWPVTIFRPQGVFGQYDSWQVGFVYYRLIRSLPIFVFPENNSLANPLFVDDLVKVFLLSMNDSVSYGSTYGVAGDDVVSLFEFIEICGKQINCTPILHYVDKPAMYDGFGVGVLWGEHDLVADCKKVKTELGLKLTPLDEAIGKTFLWLKNNPAHLKRYSFREERYILKHQSIPLFFKIYWNVADLMTSLNKRVRMIKWLRNSNLIIKSFLRRIVSKLHSKPWR
jgi:nucleoside-diphosphate-sugar epimerase